MDLQKIVLRIKLEFGIIKAVLQQCSVPGDWLSSLADRKNIPNLVPSISHLTAPLDERPWVETYLVARPGDLHFEI